MQKFLRQVAKRGLCCTKFFVNRNANHFSKLNFKQLPGRAPRTWPKWGTSTIGYARTSDLVMNARFSPIGGTMRPVSRMAAKLSVLASRRASATPMAKPVQQSQARQNGLPQRRLIALIGPCRAEPRLEQAAQRHGYRWSLAGGCSYSAEGLA